jgi:hypothetical protein
VEDTWASRDLPVLEAIVSAFNDPERFQLRIPELTGLCGLPERDVVTALRALGTQGRLYWGIRGHRKS